MIGPDLLTVSIFADMKLCIFPYKQNLTKLIEEVKDPETLILFAQVFSPDDLSSRDLTINPILVMF